MKYKEIIELNGKKMTRVYVASLDKQQREELIEPLFQYFRQLGWMFPDFDPEEFNKTYKSLVKYVVDIKSDEVYNNVSLATNICQYFCRNSYYNTTEKGNNTFIDNFNDDTLLRKICWNRLGLGWYDTEKGETFNITPKMIMYQAQRSLRLVPQISFFKPSVAKLIYSKYSNEGDRVYDFSVGFGARALGALSCNREYIGVDPLTTNEVKDMLEFLKLSNYKLINGVSEEYIEEENSFDFAFSSPPYFDQEYYSSDSKQAYSKGEDYFYNVYWKNTLKNIRYMVKNNKFVGINLSITKKYDKMRSMAFDVFGEPVEVFKLRTVRSHLNKTDKSDAQKLEPVYIFKNYKS